MNEKQIKYAVVKAFSLSDLEMFVNKNIEKGWESDGGVTRIKVAWGTQGYVQVMTYWITVEDAEEGE